MNKPSPVWALIIGGLIRTALAAFGSWLLNHHIIGTDAHQLLLTEGVSDVMGWGAILLAAAWSAANKSKLMAWVRAALHLDAGRATIADVKDNAKRDTQMANVPL